MRKVGMGLLLAVFCYSASSQDSGILSGHVYDALTKLPIENVALLIEGHPIQTVSNADGSYEFRNIPAGQQKLVAQHVSYAYTERSVNIMRSERTVLDLYMEQKVEPLKEVVIEGFGATVPVISKLPYVESSFTRESIRAEGTRDIVSYLRSSRNISGIRKGGTQLDPVVRGFRFGQLNVQMNSGQKIEGGCPNRMDPATAHVEIEDIQSVQVIKGPYALRYGPAFGGIISLNTEIPPHTDSSYVHLEALQSYESNWNGNKQYLNVYGGYKWFYYNFSGGRKDYGNYKDGNGETVSSAFRKYNYRGQIGLVPFRNHTLSFNFEESKGRDIRFPTLPMDERMDDTRLLSADYSASPISTLLESVRLKVYQSDVRHEMDNKDRPFSDTVVAVSVINAVNTGARAEAGLDIAGGQLHLGADYEHISKDGERLKTMITQPGLPVKEEMLWNNALITNLGLFAEFTRRIRSWEIVGSVRVDLNDARSDDIVIRHPMQGEIYHYGSDSIGSDHTNFSFSLASAWELNKNLTLSLAVGRGVRSPDMTERFIILLPIGYDKFDYLGNPQLKPEKNNQADLTLKYSNPRFGMFQLNGFFALVNDYITGKRLPPAQQKPLTTDVLGVKQFINAGNARLRGFEFSCASPPDHKLGGALFAAYTYGTLDEVLKYTTNEAGEVTGDELLKDDALTEIPPLEASLSIHYRLLGGRLIPRFNVRMAGAQNHVSEASYEKGTPGFIIAGFSVSYKFNSYVRLDAGVNNLFDEAYYEHLNRNIIGTSTDLYEPGRSFYFNLLFNF